MSLFKRGRFRLLKSEVEQERVCRGGKEIGQESRREAHREAIVEGGIGVERVGKERKRQEE